MPQPRLTRRAARSVLVPGSRRIACAAIVLGVLTLAVTGCGSSSSSSANATTASASSSCKPAHAFSTLTKGELTVSTYNFPPATIIEGNGKLGGIEGAMLTKIAAEECLKLNVAVNAAAGVVPAVQSGRADTAAGDWTLTVPRVKVMSHSMPFYNEPMVLISKRGQVTSIAQLRNYSVGTAEGNFWNDALNSYIGGHLKLYQSALQAYQDAQDGRLQVVVDGLLGAYQWFKQHQGTDLKYAEPAPLAAVTGSQHEQKVFYITHGNTAMVTAFNADINQMIQSGYVKQLIQSSGLPASSAETNAAIVLQ
jgi:polar amino acid transport system substrate-binding protein